MTDVDVKKTIIQWECNKKEWICTSNANSCYCIDFTRRSIEQIEQYCYSINSTVAVIDNDEELDLLVNLLSNSQNL